MCVYFGAMMCASRLVLGWAQDVFKFCMLHIHAFFMHTYLYLSLFWYWFVLVLFCVFLSLSLFWLVALWHLNENPLHPWTLFVLGHLPLILPPPMFDSMIRRPSRTSWRTFHNVVFIQNDKSFYQIFSILTFPLSSIVGVGSHCVAPQSLVPPWSYRNFIPICTDSILQYLIYHSCLRYAHRSYSGYCIRGTTSS